VISLSELKILKPIVLTVAVDVVDRFAGGERTANVSRHDEAMLWHVSHAVSHRGEFIVWIDELMHIATRRERQTAISRNSSAAQSVRLKNPAYRCLGCLVEAG